MRSLTSRRRVRFADVGRETRLSIRDRPAREDFEGCSFVNVLLEIGDLENPVGKASARHLENIRTVVRTLAEEAELREPVEFARSWHILMKGSIVQAGEGDLDAAKRAQRMARLLIEQYR
jgi:hypothetical protein